MMNPAAASVRGDVSSTLFDSSLQRTHTEPDPPESHHNSQDSLCDGSDDEVDFMLDELDDQPSTMGHTEPALPAPQSFTTNLSTATKDDIEVRFGYPIHIEIC